MKKVVSKNYKLPLGAVDRALQCSWSARPLSCGGRSDSKDRQWGAPETHRAAAPMGGDVEQTLFPLLGWWDVGKSL